MLYRKVNTRARGVHHLFGGDYRHERNAKGSGDLELERGSMHGHHQRGLDYTPLFRFLISKVGSSWEDVYREILPRVDRKEPIFWIVSRNDILKKPIVRIGESSYYSGLFVDEDGTLQLVDATLTAETLEPMCACCTHTFNGEPFGRPFSGIAERLDK